MKPPSPRPNPNFIDDSRTDFNRELAKPMIRDDQIGILAKLA
jgi:hypothetical protein